MIVIFDQINGKAGLCFFHLKVPQNVAQSLHGKSIASAVRDVLF